MPQTFWETEEYQNFNKFREWVDANYFDWDAKTQRKNRAKLRQGIRKMKALALGWGLEFTEPEIKCLSTEAIKWVDFDVKGVDKVGLWTGKNFKTEDGHSVFNVFWFNKLMKGSNPERAKFIIKLLVDMNGEPYDESDYCQ